MGFAVVMFIYFGAGYIRDEIAERKMLKRLRRSGQ
jgi:hypothetical protein